MLLGSPRRLLRILTGDIGNPGLPALVDAHLATIVDGLGDHRCVELSRTHVTWR